MLSVGTSRRSGYGLSRSPFGRYLSVWLISIVMETLSASLHGNGLVKHEVILNPWLLSIYIVTYLDTPPE